MKRYAMVAAVLALLALVAIGARAQDGVVTLASGLASPSALILDAEQVYLIDGATVKKVSRNGGVPPVLVTTLFLGITDLAVDANNVYMAWTAGGGGGRIDKAPLVGGSAVLLAAANQPTVVRLDSSFVYWPETNSGPTAFTGVRRVPKGGGGVETLTTVGNSYSGLDLDESAVYYTYLASNVFPAEPRLAKVAKEGGAVVDLAVLAEVAGDLKVDGGSVYWIEPNSGAVKTMSVAGGAVTTLATALANPMRLAVSGGLIYWTEWAGGVAGAGVIKNVSTTGGVATIVIDGLSQPWDIAVVGDEIYWSEWGTDGTNGTVKKLSLAPPIPPVPVVLV